MHITSHACTEREGFFLSLVGYPHALYRCCLCGMPMRWVPLDDLEEADLDLAIEMIYRYHQERR